MHDAASELVAGRSCDALAQGCDAILLDLTMRGLEDEPAPPVDESLEDDVDFELFELADDVAEVEDGASRIDTEEIPADTLSSDLPLSPEMS